MQNKVCWKTLRGLLGCFVQNVHHTLGMLRPPFPLPWCLVIFLSGKLICLLMEQIIFADTLSRCLLGCWLAECVINAIAFKCEGGKKVWIFCIWKLCGHYPTGHGFVDRSSVSGWQIRDRTMLDLLAFSWTLWGEKMCRTWVKSHAAKCIVRLIIPPIVYEPALS